MVHRFVLLLVESNVVLKTLVPDEERPLCNSCVTLVIGPPVAKPTHEMGFVAGVPKRQKGGRIFQKVLRALSSLLRC